jgi:hypothetical protein
VVSTPYVAPCGRWAGPNTPPETVRAHHVVADRHAEHASPFPQQHSFASTAQRGIDRARQYRELCGGEKPEEVRGPHFALFDGKRTSVFAVGYFRSRLALIAACGEGGVRSCPGPGWVRAGQKVISGSPKKSAMKLTKKKPKNTTLTNSSTVCHHFGRAVLGSLLFR